MTKYIILEIPFPEIENRSVTKTWEVKYIGVYEDYYKVCLIKRIVNWFKNPKNDGQYIIDNGGQLALEIYIDGLINRFDRKYIDDVFLRNSLVGFLYSYNSDSGLELQNIDLEIVEKSGDGIGIVGSKFVYENIDKLVDVLVQNYTTRFNKPMYEYKIVEK